MGNAENFEREVLKLNGTVLVDFWANWCGPCRMQGEIIEEMVKSHEELTVVKVNVDENPDLAYKYKVNLLPTLVVFDRGVEKTRGIGLHDAVELSELLEIK